MLDQSPLARHAAGIAADMRAQATDLAVQAGLVAALHALILHALAHLLTRLEHMVALWQAGLLAPAGPRSARNRRASARENAASNAAPNTRARAAQARAHPAIAVRRARRSRAPATRSSGIHLAARVAHLNTPADRTPNFANRGVPHARTHDLFITLS